ncbi:MAG: MAPEG family protein [Alphaproteobacteria bacterium]|nr:MAPEG family protein [Alphaproteobacteria bacterium]
MAITTGLYAALLALLAIYLGGSVGALRGKKKIAIGDGGDQEIVIANRRHMNFVENVPLILILMAVGEINGTPATWIHAMGASLVVARIVHPFGLNMSNPAHPARVFGAAVTALVTVAAAVILLWQAFGAK